METSAHPPRDAVGVYLEAPAPAFTDANSNDAAKRKRAFSGIAYSGDSVSYWGENLVIELSSLILPDPCPILMNHDRDRPVGFGRLIVRDNALHAEGTLLSNDEARSLAANADDGFPWQLSIHAEPGTVEEVTAGATVQVNGRQIAGPITIFRQSRIRELSFTPTGVDYRTEAHVLSAPILHSLQPAAKGNTMPTIEELQTQLTQLSARAETAEAQAVAATDRAENAERSLAAAARAARLASVQGLFTSLGRPIEEKDAEAYLSLSEEAWARISADLSKAKPANAPDHLFSEQATGEPNEPTTKGLNLSAIYQARRKVNK